MSSLLQDLRYAWRGLWHRPAFTLIAALTLALAIGANTALFSVVHTVLLKPFPYPQPEQLVHLRENRPDMGTAVAFLSPLEYMRLREASDSLVSMAALVPVDFHLESVEGPQNIKGAQVTEDFFTLFGVEAQIGRLFTADEGQSGAPGVVLLSHGLWQRRFGGDPAVVGRPLTMLHVSQFGPSTHLTTSFHVIGVLSPTFEPPIGEPELYVPFALGADADLEDKSGIYAFGRLRDDVGTMAAARELTTIFHNIPRDPRFDLPPSAGVTVRSLYDHAVLAVRQPLHVLMAAVIVLLLIACVNIANLFLTRGAGRGRELAVRLALGASRRRLLRQLLTESVVVAFLGAVLGFVLSHFCIRLLHILDPQGLPRRQEIAISPAALAFTLAITAATALLIGLLPTLRSLRPKIINCLRTSGGTASGNGPLRNLLMTVEVALATALLLGAGLLIQSLRHLQEVDLGFDPNPLLTLRLSVPEIQYPRGADRAAFFTRILERIGSLPGVVSASACSLLPVADIINEQENFYVEGVGFDGEAQPAAAFRRIAPGYFETLQVPLLRGKTLELGHMRDDRDVVWINQAIADKFFRDEDPIDQRLNISGHSLRIAGVVGDIRLGSPQTPPIPTLYVPSLTAASMSIVLRARDGEPSRLIDGVVAAIREIDPTQPPKSLRTMNEAIEESLARAHFNTLLLGLFSLLALVLAAVGIYGVLSYSIAQRTREMGLRMALGARRRDVSRLVLRQGMRLVLLGLALGILLAIACRSFLASMLFGIGVHDPLNIFLVSLLLLGVSFLAMVVPILRATRVDPVIALRHE